MSRHSHFELDVETETLVATSTFHVLLAAGDGAVAAVSGANDGAMVGEPRSIVETDERTLVPFDQWSVSSDDHVVVDRPKRTQGGDVVEVATVEGRVALGITDKRLQQSVKLTGLKVTNVQAVFF